MFLAKFPSLFLKILRMKFEIKLPKKNRVLVFDREGSEILKKTLGLNTFEILHIRNEKINLTVVFFLAIKFQLNYLNYYLKIIELVDPKLIITFMDNNIDFYKLKKHFNKKVFISIQNGHRMAWGDIFGKLASQKKKDNLSADYIITFNKNISKKYKKYIKCKTLNYGSLKNNHVPTENNISSKKNSLVYISAYRNKLWDIQNKKLRMDEYDERFNKKYKYELEEHIHFDLPKILKDFCCKNNMKFNILGMSNSRKEINFYKKILKNKFNFIKKKNLTSNYIELQKHNLVVSSVSTLGYEALIRKTKICFVSPNISKREQSYKFGWPYVKKDKDFFFINDLDEKKIEKILLNLKKMSRLNWNTKIHKFRKNLMDYDYKNIKLREKIKQVLN